MNLKSLLSILGAWTMASATASDYQEKWRPHFHFTPAKNWMNDPNGLVFYEGEYHLFYQHNPFGDRWGHMSWGHAVSTDLVHWSHLPLALPEENDIAIFSGSAVVDWKNTSGFGRNGKPPLVAIYTGHYNKKPLQNQQIAYSNDRGRTWTKYSGNPVLDINEADFRDPKVFWHEPTKRWVMTVAWCVPRKIRFYASPNLKDWTHLSDFGPAGSTTGIYECPDLLQVPMENSRSKKWVLIVNVGGGGPAGGTGCQYFIGDFDGQKFTLDPSYPKPQPEIVPNGRVFADFENGYGDWKAEGNAFDAKPASGKIGTQQPVTGFTGQGLVNSFLDGDASRGMLSSPQFEISTKHINFLIGGGQHPGKTGMRLLVEGKAVRTATGANAERLKWQSWEVEQWRGKKGQLEIFDQETGGWGHINVDQISFADAPARAETEPVLWAEYAPDYYAAVSWSDIPAKDGRALWIGWMSNGHYANDVPTSPWRSAMSVARELTVRKTDDGLRLIQAPAREHTKLRGKVRKFSRGSVAKADEWLAAQKLGEGLWEIEIEAELPRNSRSLVLELLSAADQRTTVEVSPREQLLRLNRKQSGKVDFNPGFAREFVAPVRLNDDRLRLRMLVDRSSVELFADDGEAVMTALILPEKIDQLLRITAGDEKIRIRSLTIWELKSAAPILSTQ